MLEVTTKSYSRLPYFGRLGQRCISSRFLSLTICTSRLIYTLMLHLRIDFYSPHETFSFIYVIWAQTDKTLVLTLLFILTSNTWLQQKSAETLSFLYLQTVKPHKTGSFSCFLILIFLSEPYFDLQRDSLLLTTTRSLFDVSRRLEAYSIITCADFNNKRGAQTFAHNAVAVVFK